MLVVSVAPARTFLIPDRLVEHLVILESSF